jgi:hypothetical protein
VTLAKGQPSAPATGQVTAVSIKGCAVPSVGGPPPLTQIHFQTLSPQGAGAVKVLLTSQPFDIPVCARRGAGAQTVTTYRPFGLCINRGDYVAFNDEGGFVAGAYRAGVPYRVMAASSSSTMDSYLMPGGTNNGDLLSPSVLASAEGFAANPGQELLLRATLATGANAVAWCRHGIPG